MTFEYFYLPGSCSLAAHVLLEWTQQSYRLIRTKGADLQQPEFRRINPKGKVPALQAGPWVITENAAVLTYLAERAPQEQLLPEAGSTERIELITWLSYLASGFHAAFTPYFAPHRFIGDEARYDDVRQAAIQRIRGEYEYVYGLLEGRRFVLGERRSILDPYLFATARWGRKLFDLEQDFPNLARHQALLEEDPAVRLVLAIEADPSAVAGSKLCEGHVVWGERPAGEA